MKPKELSRQVRDNVVEKFKAWLGYGKNIPSFEHLTEHCWIHHVHRHSPSNQTKLELFCKEEWADISVSVCASLVETHPERLATVIAAKGGSTVHCIDLRAWTLLHATLFSFLISKIIFYPLHIYAPPSIGLSHKIPLKHIFIEPFWMKRMHAGHTCWFQWTTSLSGQTLQTHARIATTTAWGFLV